MILEASIRQIIVKSNIDMICKNVQDQCCHRDRLRFTFWIPGYSLYKSQKKKKKKKNNLKKLKIIFKKLKMYERIIYNIKKKKKKKKRI